MYGSSVGVKNINLEVPKGSIFGFLGPNGAGKTTTISMLIDLIRPNSGEIQIFNLDIKKESRKIRERIGFLSSDMMLDRNLTGWQALTYYGNLHGGISRTYVQALAKRLDSDLTKPIKALSRGNRQKVGLISALMHEPELLVLDEPTSGLDPLIQAEFNQIIYEHQQNGHTTFVSSHVLSEIQVLCDHMAFIRAGKLVAVKSREELVAGAIKHVRVITNDKKLLPVLSKLQGVNIEIGQTDQLIFSFSGNVNTLLTLLSKHRIEDVIIQEADLETIFMGYYE